MVVVKGKLRSTAVETVPWDVVELFVGADGPRVAVACVCRAALGCAARTGVAVPMYRARCGPEDGACVITAREGEPRGGGCPCPWLAGCFSLTPALEMTYEGGDCALLFRGKPHHALPKVPLGPSLRELVSRGANGVGDADLLLATGITALDASDNRNVTTVAPYAHTLRRLTARGEYCRIGDRELALATRLEHLESAGNCHITSLAPFSSTLRHVGGLLEGCYKEARVDLSGPMPALSSIGDGFLSGCSNINTIDLGGLANVTRIGNGFLSGMHSLTALDLRPLSQVESVGYGFLDGCSALDISRVQFGNSPVWRQIRQSMLGRR